MTRSRDRYAAPHAGRSHSRLTTLAMIISGCLLLTGVGAHTAASATSAPDAPDATGADKRPQLPEPIACHACWHPDVRTTWDWVLSQVPQTPYRDVEMYDVDGFEMSRSGVAAMHAAGIQVVCYLSAGTYEKYRPDANRFPERLVGSKNGWPGERWLDVRELQNQHSVLRSIMDDRLDMCRDKGFDMVELDNVDGYLNESGFPLRAADQGFFNATLANDAHMRGMSVLQKNDNEQIPALLPYFDGALNEQCNQYRECTTKQNGRFGLDQYVDAGKPVFQAEYKLKPADFCAADNADNFNGVRFALNLAGKTFHPCR